MMKAIIYQGKKTYNSKQVRELLNVEFDLLLHLFQENKKQFVYGKDYFYVDREKFATFTGEHIKGISTMIYIWTSEGIDLLRSILESERQLTLWDVEQKDEVIEKKDEVIEKKVKKVNKTNNLNIYVPSEGLDVGDVARALQSVKIIDFGQNSLFRKLRNRGVLNSYNIPYQQYIKNGMFGIFIQERKNGHHKGEYIKCKVFEKGIEKIIEWFGEDSYGGGR